MNTTPRWVRLADGLMSIRFSRTLLVLCAAGLAVCAVGALAARQPFTAVTLTIGAGGAWEAAR